MKVNDLFFELSNEDRYKLFRKINKKPLRHSDLKNILKIPGPEVSRHIKRLLKLKLIHKKLDQKFYPTNYGSFINENLDLFESGTKYINFINTHHIDAIPKELKKDLGLIKKSEFSNQTMFNIEHWSEIIKNAKDFIWAITDQFQASIIPIIQQKLSSQKLEIKSILGSDLLNKLVTTEDWEKKVKGKKPDVFQELFETIGLPENIRKLDLLKLSLTITESSIILFLTDDKGIDYSECIYSSSNKDFIRWGKKLFNYYWEKAEKIESDELLPK
ncbi:MAG: DUF1724 domain-containing protein [Candidatus Lokiarchaeota archaeon]|nr:DUF1724 domain-containing protein [Candidatus Lokiarchaeota archaeon]